jgi:DNA topoisomerase-1
MPGGARISGSSGLRYVSDASLKIRRLRKGRGFVYVLQGRVLREVAVLKRLAALVIPPAWKEVQICSRSNGHLQATGRDDRGRKQYLYHPEWRRVRDRQKYARMWSFAKVLPKIRRRVRRDLRQRGLTKEKVLAAVVRLLELSCIRVGNEEYARNNHSFGLTTLRDRHVKVTGEKLRFRFRGKSGKEHSVALSDNRLARVVGRCQEIPGQMLFQYRGEDGRQRKIESGDVNDYLREISGGDYTAKDFRTWAATVQMVAALAAFPPFRSKAAALKNVNAAIQVVADRMGNTPTICRKCYVHPDIMEAYVTGRIPWPAIRKRRRDTSAPAGRMKAEEVAVLQLLQHRRG